MHTTLNSRDLRALIDADEAQRRRERYERRTGRVHRRRNLSDRRFEAQSSNTKRGNAWKNEVWA